MKRKIRYHLRLFFIATICIWSVIAIFAWFVYRQEKHRRVEMVAERIRLAVGNVIDVHEGPREGGREVQP